jgi:hypothetical protein
MSVFKILDRSAILAGLILGCSGWSGCSGSGSSGGSSSQDVVLLDVQFPDPSGQSGADESQAPRNASLVQQIIFEFSEPPTPDSVHRLSLRVRDEQDFAVDGSYDLQGSLVIFTPVLPSTPLQSAAQGWDTGGTGLQPAQSYFVEVIVGAPDSIANLVGIDPALRERFPHPTLSRALLTSFVTTEDSQLFFTGLAPRPLNLQQVTPVDGTELAPNLLEDPQQRFEDNQVIELVFDGPLHPGLDNVGESRFQLLDLDESSGSLVLGVKVELVENGTRESRILVSPSGILPLGHLLALQIPQTLRHLSDSVPPSSGQSITAVYSVQSASDEAIQDVYQESFDSIEYFDEEGTFALAGAIAAEWNRQGSGVLQAAAAFPGGGELGRFTPPHQAEEKVVSLDTNRQVFPLLDGSTPDAPAQYWVDGGVFHFTDIVIPANVTLRPFGQNPLILTATGSVEVYGTIDLSGSGGVSESGFDSGIVPVPGGRGGPGGSNGGSSHPAAYYPPGQYLQANLVTPKKGRNGGSPSHPGGGGRGGPSGILDDPDVANPEINCSEWTIPENERGRGAHGGGGTFFGRGNAGKTGVGSMLPQGDGTWVDQWPTIVLPGGSGGPSPFRDGNPLNDFIGLHGEVSSLIGGQGGGGGGSKAEGYYCGTQFPWGLGEFAGRQPDSVSDSRGGGGGGGAGSIEFRALKGITLHGTARIYANGGTGGGGEITGSSYWGGGGGGGSGGAVLFKSAQSIEVQNGARVEVRGGEGNRSNNHGGQGDGGHGIVQFQVPSGFKPQVTGSPVKPNGAWSDPDNVLNPSEFSPESQVVCRWIDVGQAIRRPPAGTNPLFHFWGTDALGRIVTDGEGFVQDPESKPFTVAYLGLRDPVTDQYKIGEEPRSHWIPPAAEIRIEFQGADAIAPGSREVEPTSISPWTASPDVANGRQFLRWRVLFHVATDGQPITGDTRRPVLRDLRVSYEF